MEASTITRQFKYKGTNLGDPNPSVGIEQIRDIFTTDHPELANAAIDGPKVEGSVHTYNLVVSAGTKG